ncbi:MAG: AraC family transcriptional regulator [Solibacillus sp.]
MKIHLLAKDYLEGEGIRWIIESQLTGIKLKKFDSIEEFACALESDLPDLLLLDMESWTQNDDSFGELLQKHNIHWLGISSERIFRTAYRGLRFRAKDVLFRPFSPIDLIKHIQQIRYQLRSELNRANHYLGKEEDTFLIDYPDFLLTGKKNNTPITMIAFLTPDINTLPLLYEKLYSFTFTTDQQLFALSDFVLCIQQTQKVEVLQEEYHTFLLNWKAVTGEPLAIVINESLPYHSLKETYLETKRLMEKVFFEGYDIVLVNNKENEQLELDPFLTPLEQRKWIEMLEKRDIKGIKDWVEQEFLTYKNPYPDPEMVRVRLTSVLAQVRRYMKSYNIQGLKWETAYHTVFKQMLNKTIIYEIIQELLVFIVELLSNENEDLLLQEGKSSLVEKVQALIESHYWDTQWSLTDCADTLRINKSTLSRRFSIESGQLFSEVLHQVRIREAKRLLKETDLPLEKISKLSGYTYQSYFNKKFKQLVGQTPFSYKLNF